LSPWALLSVILAVVGCLLFVNWRAKRQLTLFVIWVQRGRITSIKGRLPQRLLDDIADIARREDCRDLRIICRIEDSQARLGTYGATSPGLEQMLRNVVGEYPVLRLKQAPRVVRR
jgi:hypothetical protein